MPRTAKDYVPRYGLHRASGQARVEIDGKTFYLGPYKSKASYLQYDRLITEWLAGGRCLVDPGDEEVTVNELIAAFWKWAESYYGETGRRRGTLNNMKPVLSLLRQYYGETPAVEFGPKRLVALRSKLIQRGQSRNYVNDNVQLIKRVFKRGVAEELIPAEVFNRLAAVEGLRKGRTEARESSAVPPVPDAVIQATLPYLPVTVADMVRLQRLTGARPGELCVMRPGDIDRSGDVWIYSPGSHKTEHHGRDRLVFIGPRAQDILRPYLLRPDDTYCFCPRESEKRRRRLAHAARKTPIGQGNKPGTNRTPAPRRSPGVHYTNDSYRRAVHRAVAKANKSRESQADAIPKWSPNQIRHTAGTDIRKRYGLEGSQVVLGHARADVTQVYAERDMKKAAEIMREVG